MKIPTVSGSVWNTTPGKPASRSPVITCALRWPLHMLNAEAELTTVQDLLGHTWITTTQRYCRLSNQKVRSGYFKAVAVLVQKTGAETFKP